MTQRPVPLHLARHSIKRLLTICVFVVPWTAASAASAACENVNPTPDLSKPLSSGWGIDHRNTRYQPNSSINTANAAQLQLKWVYGLQNQTPRSYPLVTEDTIFIGDADRGVIALDRATGCERWVHEHEGYISSAIVPGKIGERDILVFNDRAKGVYAIDASDGQPIWHTAIDDEPLPWYSGTPLVTETTVFLPIASMEVGLAVNPLYGCCTTSGGMAALDINTGKKRWYLPTIEAQAQVTGSHFFFVQEYGPSGAPVWGAPSYDKDRDWLFFGTGQNYTHPTTDTSDAIFAVEAQSGEVQWVQQYTANDAYTAACNIEALNHPNCADPTGPDVDFGAPTLLVRTKSGRELLLAGQKSADAHAMDPDTGERVWSENLGRGGIIGGVHWGLAVNEQLGLVFVPISDKKITGFPSPGDAAPGLYALDIETGSPRWHYDRQSRCDSEECIYGLSAAITATNDVVVAGSIDGFLEVYAARTGEVLWSHDSWRDYDAVNGVETTGGAFDAHGPMIADNLLIVTSGYGYVGRQRAGNALLVFEVGADNE
ncbi:MAG: PQQ-binding-like beta-propeller repeat protein [Pseudomonadales bacterium]